MKTQNVFMSNCRAINLSSIDITGFLMKVIEDIFVGLVAGAVKAYGKVLWKHYKPSLIRLKDNTIFSFHCLAFLTGIESVGAFILVCYSRSKKEYGILVTLFIVLIAVLADKSTVKPKTRFGSFLPIIKLA